MVPVLLILCLLVNLSSLYAYPTLDNGLGLTPPMGWNSWNHFQCDINEDVIRKTAATIASGPLKKAGYQYVNLDDCWQVSRNSSGYIQADPNAFPSGIPALVDYVHSLGLKFGLYSDAGYWTCKGRPGSLGYELKDAQTYSEWGVDYLKYDNCSPDGEPPEQRYPKMRDALLNVSRPIFYSICDWGQNSPANWAPEVGNSWRTWLDIKNNWSTMLANIDENNKWAYKAGPGAWNDPDMLEVGNGNLTTIESRAHFSLWAISKSPLLLGLDVTAMSDDTIKIITNPEVIAINQDKLGVQAIKVVVQETTEVWAGPLEGRAVTALLFNRSPTAAANITAQFKDIFVPYSTASVRDVWAQKDLGVLTSITAEVAPHGVMLYKVTY